jgi:hypothetical protein
MEEWVEDRLCDTYIDSCYSHGLKLQTMNSYIINVRGNRCGLNGSGVAIDFSGETYTYPEASDGIGRWLWADDSNIGISVASDTTNVQHFKVYDCYYGFRIVEGLDSCIIKDGYIKGCDTYGFRIESAVEPTTLMKNIYVEDIETHNNNRGIGILGEGNNIYFKRCKSYDNDDDGVYISDLSSPYDDGYEYVYLEDMLIYGNSGDGIFCDYTDHLYIINNTFYDNTGDDVNASTGTTNIYMYNTIYDNVTGIDTESNNYDYGVSGNPFVNASAGDFRVLKSSGCYDAGDNSKGDPLDINGYHYKNNREIGCDENIVINIIIE